LESQVMRVPKRPSRREFVHLSGLAAGAAGLTLAAAGRATATLPVERDPILADAVTSGGVTVAGAGYDLRSGKVMTLG
jgi:hypothetical protein